VETAAQVVSDPAARHSRERLFDDLARPLRTAAAIVRAREQECDRGGVRKLGCRAEAAIPDIEQARHLISGAAYKVGADGTGLRLVQRLDDVVADRARVGRHPVPLLAERTRGFHQDAVESRPAIRIVVGWEVGAAEKDLAVRCQERRERPASLAAERLNRALVPRVHVGPLVPIHLDAHEIAIQHVGDRGVLVRLTVHHVAPVAPHRADVEQDRFFLVSRTLERRIAPRHPVDGLMRGGLEICRGF